MITLMYILLMLIIVFEVFSIFKPIVKSLTEYKSIKSEISYILIRVLISILAGYFTFKIGTGIIFALHKLMNSA